MADQFVLYIDGLDAIRSFDEIPAKMLNAARIALNDAARKGRTLAAKEVLRETAFPASYVAPRGGRLAVKNFASNKNLEAIIAGKTRPTSLARFVQGPISVGGGKKRAGLRVKVDPTKGTRLLPRAFLIKLRSGRDIDTKGNVGVAVRTTNGRPPPGYKPAKIADGLYLLAGPSVAQNLYSETNRGGVFTDISPKVAEMIETEFWRQMDLK